jgi:uncharacterized protein YndB with AHSA1/START domain
MIADKSCAEIRRSLAHSPEKVFAAFASADLVERWLTPSPEIRLTVVQFDFREGGSYRFAYHVPVADLKFRFLEVSRSHSLALLAGRATDNHDETGGIKHRVNDDSYPGIPPPLHNPWEQKGDRQQCHQDPPAETPVEQTPWNSVSQPRYPAPGRLLTRQDIATPAQLLAKDIGNK